MSPYDNSISGPFEKLLWACAAIVLVCVTFMVVVMAWALAALVVRETGTDISDFASPALVVAMIALGIALKARGWWFRK